MGAERFFVSEINPNDQIGGGGCVCSEGKHTDCKGPFAVFYHTSSDNNLSPHVVLSLSCAEAFIERSKGEHLAAGERDECLPLAEPSVL